MTFELKGSVRADEVVKVPLFGPPDQVRLEDVARRTQARRAQIAFDSDGIYAIYTGAE